MLSSAGCQNSQSLAPLLLQARLQGSFLVQRAFPSLPGSLPPVHVTGTISPPFLYSSMGLLSMLGSGESILLVFCWFPELFRQMWVESKPSAGRHEPSILLHRHLPPFNGESWFFERVNKIDNTLAICTKRKEREPK